MVIDDSFDLISSKYTISFTVRTRSFAQMTHDCFHSVVIFSFRFCILDMASNIRYVVHMHQMVHVSWLLCDQRLLPRQYYNGIEMGLLIRKHLKLFFKSFHYFNITKILISRSENLHPCNVFFQIIDRDAQYFQH